MRIKLISLSDYRKNLSKYAREAKKKNISYIVLVHGKPVIEVKPAKDDLYLESPNYAQESWDEFDSSESFLADLKSHHNTQDV